MSTSPRRKSWILIAVLCALLVAHVFLRLYLPGWPAASRAETEAGVRRASETAVRKVLDDQVSAWNRGDLEGFMLGYWNSPDVTYYSGKEITSGWKENLERYRKRYQSEGREMGQLSFTGVDVKALGTSDAWARGRWKVVKSTETLEGLFTLIFHREVDGWRIIHDHTSVAPAPPAPVKKPPQQ
jgi:ketosteroid isomerase-like protein